MPTPPLRHLTAALLLSLAMFGAAADASRWGTRGPICPHGIPATFPAKCPPPPDTPVDR